MNPKNNSSIANNSNKIKNTTILEKLKNIKLQLSKYKNNKFFVNNNSDNNKIINKSHISSTIKENDNNYNIKINPKIKTNINSPKNLCILINKDLTKNKNIININLNNKNNHSINRSFENRKYKKLKNKTPEISRVSSTKYNKDNIIKYKNRNNNNYEKEIFAKVNKNKNKKYDNINLKIKKVDYKSNQSINNNNILNKNINNNKKIDN